MKILTLGASPYLLVRDAKIHADIIDKFYNNNIQVTSVVWNHDTNYFIPDSDGKLYYESKGNYKIPIYAIDYRLQTASVQVYDLMKMVQPDIVVTIGSYEECSFLAAIKMMYPNIFKWISVYTSDTSSLLYNNKDAFEYVDYIVATSEMSYNDITKVANVNGKFLPYGADHSNFYEMSDINRNGLLYSARNTLASNLPAFIMSVSNCGMRAHLHTNIYDLGDYNIDDLIKKYDAQNMTYTKEYCSIRDGISVEKMRTMYNTYDFYLDCGIKSATGLSMLEAMRCGCIPIGPSYGRVGEIIGKMPEEFRIELRYNTYVGANNEEYAIVDYLQIREIINKLNIEKGCIDAARKASIEVSSQFSKDVFLDNILSVTQEVKQMKQQLAVEIL